MNVLRSLLLALFVLLVGCTAPRPSTPEAPAKTRSAVPVPPAPPPLAEAAAPADTAMRKVAPLPAPPAQGMRLMAQVAAAPGIYPMPSWMAPPTNTEHYTHREDNPVQLAAEQPVSTFGIDVDTGSYTNVRRMLNEGALPPADAVRAEEFVNYFDYGYTPPTDRTQPFSVTTELAPAPWNAQRQLLLIGIQGYRVPASQIPAANLVFLIDTSGSMNEPDKLPLLKASLRQLVRQLRRQDRVAIVTYAGSAGVALPSTPGDRHATIEAAIDALGAYGSTNGGAGIDLAYAQAEQGFIKGGVNRVILATDGDFNVGMVDQQALKTRIEDHRKSGIALTTLGFGEGNYNDAMAVMLADVGNGSHHYIDSLQEGRRVLVQEMSATLLTIAKDVKIQVEFNPAQVKEYRLIGYEKRVLRREDFNNDKVDAGEIGAGANVTALYEIVPQGSDGGRIDPLRYGAAKVAAKHGDELAFLRLRYKLPGQSHSRLIERPIAAQASARASERLRFAAAVAAFADQLRGGKGTGDFGYRRIAALAGQARGNDPQGYRAGFVQLVGLADGLATHAPDGGAPTAAR
ncbi:vWA domain-containing protein [Frateuria sp. YIM B11624]|uniref:vWA domain-containing protein n=1 Tax=Frateuria sp. YIM B11624 TaxID=3143185 RepID=UPI003C7271FD